DPQCPTVAAATRDRRNPKHRSNRNTILRRHARTGTGHDRLRNCRVRDLRQLRGERLFLRGNWATELADSEVSRLDTLPTACIDPGIEDGLMESFRLSCSGLHGP